MLPGTRTPSRRENMEILGGELERRAGKLLEVMADSRLIDKPVDLEPFIDSGPLEGLE